MSYYMKVKASNYVGLTQEHTEKIKSRCVADPTTGCLAENAPKGDL
jgi:hypothetical protein